MNNILVMMPYKVERVKFELDTVKYNFLILIF